MGLLDITSRVLTSYKADVSDHIKGLEKLKGAERERAQATIDEHKRIESSLQKQVDAIGMVQKGFEFAKESFRVYSEDQRLRAAAGTADIEKLRKASLGLKTETQLLADAARLNNGAFKLTSEQMVIAEKAMLAFTRRGFESAEANKKVLDAVTSLKVDGLADLGVFVDKAGLSMEKAEDRAKIYKNVMAELAKVSGDVKEGQLTAAEGVEAAGVRLQDSWRKIQGAVGSLVVALEPFITALAKVVALAGEVAAYAADPKRGGRDLRIAVKGGLQAVSGIPSYGSEGLDKDALDEIGPSGSLSILDIRNKYDPSGAGGGFPAFVNDVFPESVYGSGVWKGKEELGNALTAAYNTYAKQKAALDERIARDAEAATGALGAIGSIVSNLTNNPWSGTGGASSSGRGGSRPAGRDVENIWDDGVSKTIGLLIADAMAYLKENSANGDLLAVSQASDEKFSNDRLNALLDNARKSLTATGDALSADDRYNAFASKSQDSKLAKMFGPLEEINGYKVAFDALAGGVSAAMSAWIDGSQSAGKAFKQFIAEAMKGLAIQMAVEALKESAYGFGSLAWGNTGKAAMHFKSAAGFAAGAAAAAIGAKALHSGGGGAPAGAGAAAPVGNGGGGPQYQGRREVIVIGDSFGETTPRQRALNTRRRVEEAYGAAGVLNE